MGYRRRAEHRPMKLIPRRSTPRRSSDRSNTIGYFELSFGSFSNLISPDKQVTMKMSFIRMHPARIELFRLVLTNTTLITRLFSRFKIRCKNNFPSPFHFVISGFDCKLSTGTTRRVKPIYTGTIFFFWTNIGIQNHKKSFSKPFSIETQSHWGITGDTA